MHELRAEVPDGRGDEIPSTVLRPTHSQGAALVISHCQKVWVAQRSFFGKEELHVPGCVF